jgi:hypothetical protein
MPRKHRSFIDTLKGPVSNALKIVRPTTAAKFIAVSQWLIDHNWEIDWSDEALTVFLKGGKQITLVVPYAR